MYLQTHGIVNFKIYLTFIRWKSKIETYCEFEKDFESTKIKRQTLNTLSGLVNRYFTLFLELVELPKDSYMCCGNPEVITLDGIVLSVETSKIKQQGLKTPWIIGESNSSLVAVL